MNRTQKSRLGLVAAGILLAAFVVQGLAFIRANSQTSDEAAHLAAGYSYLARGDFRLNPEHPPLIKTLSALPVYLLYRIPFQPDERLWRAAEEWRIGRDFLYSSPVPWDRILSVGRLPNLILGALLAGLVGWWSYRLWGSTAGAVVALALAAFEPNLIAHSCLVTTDLGAALFTFLAVYLFWEHVRAPRWSLLAGVGVATGLALASKYSCVVVPVILAAVAAGHLLSGGAIPSPGRKPARGTGARFAEAIPAAGAILAVALVTLLGAYYFTGLAGWWKGFQIVLGHQGLGHMAFFLGEYSTEGWWLYFPVAFLIKTPLGFLAMLAAAVIFWRAGPTRSRRDTLFLWLPVLLVFLAASRGKINIGLRHILPVYPFLMVAASRLALIRLRDSRIRAALLGAPVLLAALSSLRVAPHQLAYFNEAVGGPANGYRYLGDSNLDWGQDLAGVKAFMDREGLPMIIFSYFGNTPPAALGIRCQYAPAFGHLDRPPLDLLPADARREILAISVNSLQAVHFENKNLYRWLQDREPVARIGYSIFAYDITGDVEAHFRLAGVYLEMGPRALAVAELNKVLRLRPGHPEALRILAQIPPSPS